MPLDIRGLTRIQRAARATSGAVGRDAWVVRRARPVYEYLLKHLSGSNGIPWTINGEEYRIDPAYRQRLGETYEAEVARYLRAHVAAGEVCVDIGANIGAYALQLARWVGPGGRVIAFEPNPEAAEVLERHVKMNGIERQVTLVPAAVGAEPGVAVLHAAGADGMSRLGVPNPVVARDTRPVRVSVTSLDAYCEANELAPQWLVVDVEGFEADVLRGARRTLRRGSVRAIVAEFHPSVWTTRAGAPDGMRELLEDLHLAAAPLADQSDLFAQHGPVLLSPAS
jgi:FkbM family methyltransferase